MQKTDINKLFIQLNQERAKLDSMVAYAIKNGLEISSNLEIIKQSKLVDSLMSKAVSEKNQKGRMQSSWNTLGR